MQTKQCYFCHEWKSLPEFGVLMRSDDGHHNCCRVCKAASQRRSRQAAAERLGKVYKSRIRTYRPLSPLEEKAKRYGTTPAALIERWEQQDRKCAICREDVALGPVEADATHVDHDHSCCLKTPTCGKCIRGILCPGCNRALGGFKDDLDIVSRAADFLRAYRDRRAQET